LESEKMPFDYNFSDKLKRIILKLRKKDPRRAEIIHKKVRQIINSDEFTIEHYKNLGYRLSDKKRVHIDKSFVLTFTYIKKGRFVLFLDFEHHDKIYKR